MAEIAKETDSFCTQHFATCRPNDNRSLFNNFSQAAKSKDFSHKSHNNVRLWQSPMHLNKLDRTPEDGMKELRKQALKQRYSSKKKKKRKKSTGTGPVAYAWKLIPSRQKAKVQTSWTSSSTEKVIHSLKFQKIELSFQKEIFWTTKNELHCIYTLQRMPYTYL